MKNEKNNLILLKSFYNEDIALKTKILLERNHIFHKYIRGRSNIESAFISSNSNPYEIWVQTIDFEKSYELVKEIIPENDQDIVNVQNFSDEELSEIINNTDEWHDSYITKAYEEYIKRGYIINEDEIKLHMAEKLEEIKTGKEVHPAVLFLLWITVIFAFPFLFYGMFGGIFAVIGTVSGYYFWKIKLKAFDSQKYFLFNENARKHGKFMFFTGLIWAICFIIYLYLYYSKIFLSY